MIWVIDILKLVKRERLIDHLTVHRVPIKITRYAMGIPGRWLGPVGWEGSFGTQLYRLKCALGKCSIEFDKVKLILCKAS